MIRKCTFQVFIAIMIFSAIILIALDGDPNGRKASQHEMIKRLPEDHSDLLKPNIDIESNDQQKAILSKQALNANEKVILTPQDLSISCIESLVDVDFLYSHKLLNVVNIRKNIGCKEAMYGVQLSYKIFMDSQRAKQGAHEELSGSPGVIYEDQVNNSFTGKKYGDFCVRWGNPKDRIMGLDILQGNYFIGISISGKQELSPEILDQWAEAALTKITKGNDQ